jgi:hypothetical protein
MDENLRCNCDDEPWYWCPIHRKNRRQLVKIYDPKKYVVHETIIEDDNNNN